VDDVIKDPFTRNWLNLLCFLLSGLPADGTSAAEMAFMFTSGNKFCSFPLPIYPFLGNVIGVRLVSKGGAIFEYKLSFAGV
jgi:hypothetical protein